MRCHWLIPTFLVLLLTGCSLLPDQEDETANWTASQFYYEAKENLDQYLGLRKHLAALLCNAPAPAGRLVVRLARVDPALHVLGLPDVALRALRPGGRGHCTAG